MSSKELGQIHTVNRNFQLLATSGVPGTEIAIGDIDLPGELTSQLQRMVRAGNMFKVCGIDMTIDLGNVPNRNHIVSGYLRYFAPTRGRCAAFRGAFKAMAEQMNNQGISMRENELYDFKVPINEDQEADFKNQATLDGTTGLALVNTTATASVFGVHNASVRPTYTDTASNLYSEGFSTLLSAAGTDFVLNDTVPYAGNHNEASESYETIPFQLKFSSDLSNNAIATFQWRPYPALYLAVLCGQFQVVITMNDDSEATPPTALSTLNIAVMVSGWKSIMGNPDKKRRSKKRASRKGRK